MRNIATRRRAQSKLSSSINLMQTKHLLLIFFQFLVMFFALFTFMSSVFHGHVTVAFWSHKTAAATRNEHEENYLSLALSESSEILSTIS